MRSFGLNTCQQTDHPFVIGIIGGSGMEAFPELTITDQRSVETTFGAPSDIIHISSQKDGSTILFLPRHGSKHDIPPHKIPYRANLAALKELGAQVVVGTCIAGSLKRKIAPGHIVVPDQFVNLTWGRDDTPRTGGFLHLPMAEPYCARLRKILIRAASSAQESVHSRGTVAVIQGPRFSTKAESRFFIRNGWDIVNMTQYPECLFARELGICYATLASITDWDVGVPSRTSMERRSVDLVLKAFNNNIATLKSITQTLPLYLRGFSCACAGTEAVEYYRMGVRS